MYRLSTRQGLLTLALTTSASGSSSSSSMGNVGTAIASSSRSCVVSAASSMLGSTNTSGYLGSAAYEGELRKPSNEAVTIPVEADLYDIHGADERRVLWGPSSKPMNLHVFGVTAASGTTAGQPLEDAYRLWLRLGHDALLDGAASPILNIAGVTTTTTAADIVWRKEDAVGANLLAPDLDEQHTAESRKIWGAITSDQYVASIKYAHGAAKNTVGTVQMTAGADAADRADATWSQDAEFVRLSKLCQEFFGKPCSNREQIELAIRQADAESFGKYLSALGATDALCLPVPATSGATYEKEELTEWATLYQTARLAAADTHAALKSAAVSENWSEVAANLADIAGKIAALRAKRQARQEAAKLIVPWKEADANVKLAQAYYYLELQYKAVAEGEMDPEDGNDTSEEWLKENEEISALAATSIGVGDVSFDTFWKHTIRIQALEFEHLLKDHETRLVAAACRVRCINEADGNIHAVNSDDTVESLKGSHWDAGANILIPAMSVNWVKLNWFIFGASNVFHHTAAGHRKLHYNNATLNSAFTAAQTFYQMRPLSQSLDYASPYVYRRSLVRAARELGLSRQAQIQEAALHPTNQLARAQRDIRVVVDLALAEYGVRRRAALEAEFKRLNSSPMAQLPNLRLSKVDDGGEGAATAEAWYLGTSLQLQLEVPDSINNGFAQIPEKTLTDVDNQTFGLEVVLLKKKAADSNNTDDADNQKKKKLVAGSDMLSKLYQQVTERCAKLCPIEEVSGDVAVADEFEFVTVLCDNLAPDAEIMRAMEDHSTDKKLAMWNFVLPRQTLEGANLCGGDYKLRVRLFDHGRNPTHVPSVCQQGFTGTFKVHDALLKDEADFFGFDTSSSSTGSTLSKEVAAKIPEKFPGEQLVSYFAHLRARGYQVPLNLEFQAGQQLSPKGDVLRGRIHDLLQKDQSSVGAAQGLTTPQLELEQHVRRHYNLLHPGLSSEEWFTRRRWVLAQALEEDFDWWHGVANETTSELFLNPATDIVQVEKRVRALRDKLQVLQATGTSNRVSSLTTTAAPLAHCRVRGDGSLDSFEIDAAVLHEEKVSSVQGVLALCKRALHDGHSRMNSLAAVKSGDVEKALTANQLAEGGKESISSGKFGRTYLYAYDKVLKELGGTSSIDAQLEAELAAMEREKEVDRMPSQHDPSLRRKTFGFTLTAQKAYAEAIPGEHKTEWKK